MALFQRAITFLLACLLLIAPVGPAHPLLAQPVASQATYLPLLSNDPALIGTWEWIDPQIISNQITIAKDGDHLQIDESWRCLRPYYCEVITGTIPLAAVTNNAIDATLSGSSFFSGTFSETQRLVLTAPDTLTVTRFSQIRLRRAATLSRARRDENRPCNIKKPFRFPTKAPGTLWVTPRIAF